MGNCIFLNNKYVFLLWRFAHLKEEQYKRSQQYIEDNEKQISQLTEMLRSKQEEMGKVL